MKIMKTDDENTYLNLNPKRKRKQTTSLNKITQNLQTKVQKNINYDKIWKYQPKKGIKITKKLYYVTI
jgi:hypothetical protein